MVNIQIGKNQRGEVVISLPAELLWRFSDINGGTIYFNPGEAREFAALILKYAALAEGIEPEREPEALPVAIEPEPEKEPAPPAGPDPLDFSDGIAVPGQWMECDT